MGICDAFRDAEFLVDAIDQGLTGRRPLDEAMADYERRRNEATLADFQMNIDLARFTPLPADQRQLLAGLRDSQEATNRFFMTREGMTPAELFFNPENLQRIMASAGAKV